MGARAGFRWGRQHQRIAQRDDLPVVVGINDFQTRQVAHGEIDVQLPWPVHHVIDASQGDFDDIVLVIVNDPKQRQPLRLDLLAKSEGCDLNLGVFANEAFR
ncbi:protein of unknown function (plasmid) [Azospirillum baldaniorum]|uniref:Uncharacterized protein n=1 Tax=Azospirillum baldaniorum TaxID=1064539 RepID=A0A9P1NPE4_9PROT|nr:protein of unknown function [Azospirillum baldaniorum]